MSRIKLAAPINVISGFALVLTIAATLNASTTNNKLLKQISIITAWSCGAVALTNKAVGTYLEQSADNQMLDETNKLTRELRESQEKSTNLQNSDSFLREINAKSEKEIEVFKQQILEKDATLQTLNATLTAKIAEFSNLANSRDNRINLIYKSAINYIVDSLEKLVDTGYTRLYNAVSTKLDNEFYTGCHEKLEQFIDILDSSSANHDEKVTFLKQLTTKQIESNEHLLENIQTALDIQGEIFTDIANLKVKFRSLLTIGDRLKSEELKKIAVDQGQKLERFRLYRDKKTELDDYTNSQFDRLATQEKEQREKAVASIDEALATIEEVRLTNVGLNQQLIELSKPQLWRPATRDDYRMGNVIIQYFEKYGYTLDRYDSDYKGWEGTVWFDGYRSKKRLILKDLNEHGEYLQQLCHSFNVLKFEYDAARDKFGCYLQFSPKPKKEKGNELPRGVRPASQFPNIVAKWKRVRITGGSESGKSPTAENVAVCMLKANPGTIDFYDPMYDSIKNYRSIPAIGHSHEDSVKGLADYSDRMNNSPSNQFYLAWFDEIDTTIDENRDSVKDVKAVIKQASHKNSGLILTGQNANVSALKGLQRSDMNNLVLVHIGSNYRDGIDNSSLSTPEKESLKKIGDELTDYCNAQNEKLAMEPTGGNADPNAYRFALILEPQKRGYYIILPEFGKYTFDELEKQNSEKTLTRTMSGYFEHIGVKSEFEVNEFIPNQSKTPSVCPKCGSTTITEIEPYKDGRKRFRCGRNHKFGFEDC